MNAALIRETARAAMSSCPERGSRQPPTMSTVNACGAALSPPLRTPGAARHSYCTRGGTQTEASDVAMHYSNRRIGTCLPTLELNKVARRIPSSSTIAASPCGVHQRWAALQHLPSLPAKMAARV